MTLDEAREAHRRGNARVAYQSGTDRAEEGVITAVGRVWVFVQYGEPAHSVATAPGDLTLIAGTLGEDRGEEGSDGLEASP
jgi:hypothetical protein